MPTPISSWHQVPPAYRERVKAELRRMVTPRERRRAWVMAAVYFAPIAIGASIWILGHRDVAWGVFMGLWVIGMLFNAWQQPALARQNARRFADAVRAVGLEAAEVPASLSWRQRWQQFAPPAKGQIDRDWGWVRQRKERVKQRIGQGLMWRYKEEMYRRRFRYLLPGIILIVVICYAPLILLAQAFSVTSTNAGPLVQMLFGILLVLPFVLMGLLLVAWIAFYFIHESWRPTWAALNSLGAPTCMRCGYDLTHHEHQPCPECGAPPGEEVVWSEPALQSQGGPGPALVRSIAPPPK